MNNTGITKVSATSRTQILFSVENQQSVSALISAEGITAGSDGKKILKAGTPLDGNLEARGTPFKKAADAPAQAVGILLHDVDVTNGNANGTVLIWGFVNMNRIDTTTQALITTSIKNSLIGIKFLKD